MSCCLPLRELCRTAQWTNVEISSLLLCLSIWATFTSTQPLFPSVNLSPNSSWVKTHLNVSKKNETQIFNISQSVHGVIVHWRLLVCSFVLHKDHQLELPNRNTSTLVQSILSAPSPLIKQNSTGEKENRWVLPVFVFGYEIPAVPNLSLPLCVGRQLLRQSLLSGDCPRLPPLRPAITRLIMAVIKTLPFHFRKSDRYQIQRTTW